MEGMENTARILNFDKSSYENSVTQGYSWIGEGDGVTDYTAKLQNKLDELHTVHNGGTIYLGSGTYPISKSLMIYDNIRIIGDGQTVIEQIADNTHAIIWNGSNITMRDLTIKLSGNCTEITSCIFTNNNNRAEGNKNSLYPENIYIWNCSISNVTFIGKYSLTWQDNYQYLSDEALAYRGVGIASNHHLYFNFFDCDCATFRHLYSGIYGGGGSNNFRIYATECRLAAYTDHGGNNRYEIKGHTYYGQNENGYVDATDYVVYSASSSDSYDINGFFDTQHTKACIYFTSESLTNICYLNSPATHLENAEMATFVGHSEFVDYGRGNEIIRPLKETYFGVGNRYFDISGQPNPNKNLNAAINNALAGAGIWGTISSSANWNGQVITLSDICRYPSEVNQKTISLASIISDVSPSEENPLEIEIDIRNRPIYGYPSFWIQFDYRYVAQNYTVSFDTKNNGNYDFVHNVVNNNEPVSYWLGNQYPTYAIYRIKISITKALIIPNYTYRDAEYTPYTIDYNPDGLIGIVNIGMPQNDVYGRAFLGECGGSLYGNVDMHQNTLKNLPNPIDNGDAVNKYYLEEKFNTKQNTITGAPGQFVVIGEDGNITTKTIDELNFSNANITLTNFTIVDDNNGNIIIEEKED